MVVDWTRRLAEELGLGAADGVDTLDIDLVLAVARDAAHGVERPAAPLATFLVGYAAALRGGGPDAIATCSQVAKDLANSWEQGNTAGA